MAATAKAVAQQEFLVHPLANGLTLVAEPIAAVRSAAFTLLIPTGSAYDPPGRCGTAYMAAELVMRGAGPRDTRQVVLDLDRLGVSRSGTVEAEYITFGGATLGTNLAAALSIYADVVQRPHLPSGELEPIRRAVLQELEVQEEDPRNKLSIELRRRHWPYPWSQPPNGLRDDVRAITYEDLRGFWEQRFTPQGAVLGVAGQFQWDALRTCVDELFGRWDGPAPAPPAEGARGERITHLVQQTAQTHIGLACDAVSYAHEEFFALRAALAVLAEGSSSRLFTEIREKRGLCYAVWATYAGLRAFGSLICYVGTTPEKATKALELLVEELERLGQDLNDEELRRAKVGLKSALIMGCESSSARANAVTRDWFYLGRVRSVREIQQAIDTLSAEAIMQHLHRFPLRNYTVVTLGPEAPELPVGLRNARSG